MNEQAEIDNEIADILARLKEDIDNHYVLGKECLSENHHFELWDRMMELEETKTRLAQ